MTSDNDRTLYVGNLSDRITEELLYELFLQAGPLECVKLPLDKASGKPKNFAFVCYRHECSVSYALYLLGDTKILGKYMNIQAKTRKPLLTTDQVGVHSLNVEAAFRNYSQGHVQHDQSSLMGNYLGPDLLQQQLFMTQLNNSISNRLDWQQPFQMPPNNGYLNAHSAANAVRGHERVHHRNEHHSYRNAYRDSSFNSYNDRYNEKDSHRSTHGRSSGSDRYYENSRHVHPYDHSHVERQHERSSRDRYHGHDRHYNHDRSHHDHDRQYNHDRSHHDHDRQYNHDRSHSRSSSIKDRVSYKRY